MSQYTVLERLRAGAHARPARVALFDFDGTISTIRSGWIDVMVPMMVELLADLHSGETEAELTALVREFVARLTGKQTIYQMIELRDQIARRGGEPSDPLVYKKQYLDRLHVKIAWRLKSLRAGDAPPERYQVPGTRSFLEALRDRGLRLILASGTDQPLVREEAHLLAVNSFFDGGIFGALDDYRSFSKRLVIANVMSDGNYRGEHLLGFGDGYVEIENIKEAGGIAVGLATDEPECLHIDPWKRKRLVEVGADFIAPNFLDRDELLNALFTPALTDAHEISTV